tara:strand:- start:124 stop:381 length:258 start_codon:yes stop_codon:yes gene_type:complete
MSLVNIPPCFAAPEQPREQNPLVCLNITNCFPQCWQFFIDPFSHLALQCFLGLPDFVLRGGLPQVWHLASIWLAFICAFNLDRFG